MQAQVVTGAQTRTLARIWPRGRSADAPGQRAAQSRWCPAALNGRPFVRVLVAMFVLGLVRTTACASVPIDERTASELAALSADMLAIDAWVQRMEDRADQHSMLTPSETAACEYIATIAATPIWNFLPRPTAPAGESPLVDATAYGKLAPSDRLVRMLGVASERTAIEQSTTLGAGGAHPLAMYRKYILNRPDARSMVDLLPVGDHSVNVDVARSVIVNAVVSSKLVDVHRQADLSRARRLGATHPDLVTFLQIDDLIRPLQNLLEESAAEARNAVALLNDGDDTLDNLRALSAVHHDHIVGLFDKQISAGSAAGHGVMRRLETIRGTPLPSDQSLWENWASIAEQVIQMYARSNSGTAISIEVPDLGDGLRLVLENIPASSWNAQAAAGLHDIPPVQLEATGSGALRATRRGYASLFLLVTDDVSSRHLRNTLGPSAAAGTILPTAERRLPTGVHYADIKLVLGPTRRLVADVPVESRLTWASNEAMSFLQSSGLPRWVSVSAASFDLGGAEPTLRITFSARPFADIHAGHVSFDMPLATLTNFARLRQQLEERARDTLPAALDKIGDGIRHQLPTALAVLHPDCTIRSSRVLPPPQWGFEFVVVGPHGFETTVVLEPRGHGFEITNIAADRREVIAKLVEVLAQADGNSDAVRRIQTQRGQAQDAVRRARRQLDDFANDQLNEISTRTRAIANDDLVAALLQEFPSDQLRQRLPHSLLAASRSGQPASNWSDIVDHTVRNTLREELVRHEVTREVARIVRAVPTNAIVVDRSARIRTRIAERARAVTRQELERALGPALPKLRERVHEKLGSSRSLDADLIVDEVRDALVATDPRTPTNACSTRVLASLRAKVVQLDISIDQHSTTGTRSADLGEISTEMERLFGAGGPLAAWMDSLSSEIATEAVAMASTWEYHELADFCLEMRLIADARSPGDRAIVEALETTFTNATLQLVCGVTEHDAEQVDRLEARAGELRQQLSDQIHAVFAEVHRLAAHEQLSEDLVQSTFAHILAEARTAASATQYRRGSLPEHLIDELAAAQEDIGSWAGTAATRIQGVARLLAPGHTTLPSQIESRLEEVRSATLQLHEATSTIAFDQLHIDRLIQLSEVSVVLLDQQTPAIRVSASAFDSDTAVRGFEPIAAALRFVEDGDPVSTDTLAALRSQSRLVNWSENVRDRFHAVARDQASAIETHLNSTVASLSESTQIAPSVLKHLNRYASELAAPTVDLRIDSQTLHVVVQHPTFESEIVHPVFDFNLGGLPDLPPPEILDVDSVRKAIEARAEALRKEGERARDLLRSAVEESVIEAKSNAEAAIRQIEEQLFP